MFGSPCSLRSTQCAALIALAAAAGISRFEPAPAKPVMPRPAGATQSLVALASLPRTHIYLAAMQALAPQFRVVRVAFELDRDTTAQSALELCAGVPADSFPPVAPPVDAPPVRLAALAPALSPGQHSYPYAVGPPWREIDKSLRVAGIAVPGGSSTRRSQLSRIAGVFVSAPSAPLTRLTDSGPALADSVSSPDSALRGEPESPPNNVRRFARLNGSTRCGATLDSYPTQPATFAATRRFPRPLRRSAKSASLDNEATSATTNVAPPTPTHEPHPRPSRSIAPVHPCSGARRVSRPRPVGIPSLLPP